MQWSNHAHAPRLLSLVLRIGRGHGNEKPAHATRAALARHNYRKAPGATKTQQGQKNKQNYF